MKKFYKSVCFGLAMLALPASAQMIPIDPIPVTPSSDSGILTTLSIATPASTQSYAVSVTPFDIHYTEWEDLADNWVYVSNYTGKSYPTKLRKRARTEVEGQSSLHTVQLELTNSLFGTTILNINPISGNINMQTSGDSPSSYVPLTDESVEGADMLMFTTTLPSNNAIGNRMQYLPSERFAISTAYTERAVIEADRIDKSQISYVTYDYLYNPNGTDAKIDITLPQYCSEHLSLKGSCGKDVTDLYYVVINNPRDTDRAATTEDADKYGLVISYENVGKLLSDYIASGKVNSSVSIGKIELDGAKNFNLTLSETWNGIQGVSLFALKEGEITDQKFEYIEMRTESGWKPYKNVNLRMNLTIDEDTLDFYKPMAMEINEEAKLIRIVNPFGTADKAHDYIYLDCRLGKDKCFMTSSYIPHTYSYTTKGIDFADEPTTTEMLNLFSFVTLNYYNGFSFEQIYRDSSDMKGWFFDLSAEAPNITLAIRTKQQWLYSFGTYVSYIGDAVLTTFDVVEITPNDNYTLSFNIGSDINSVKFKLVDSANPNNASPEYTVINFFHTAILVPLLDEIESKKIPVTADVIQFTAYDADGRVLNSGTVPVPLDFDVQIASVAFDPANFGWNTDGKRASKLTRNSEGHPVVTLLNFTEGSTYTTEDKDLTITIANGTPELESYYVNTFYFGEELGNCKVFMESSSTPVLDNNIITVPLKWAVYKDEEIKGYCASATATIMLPNDYDLTSSVDEIANDIANDAEPIYYNLQGMRLEQPAHGSIVIEVRGNTARKIFIR